MIIEVIRGLGLGGAETLLYNRLRHATETNPAGFENTLVVNTLAEASFYSEKLRALGIPVIEIRPRDPLRGMIHLNRVLEALGRGCTTIYHSPVTTYLEKARRSMSRNHNGPLIEVVHSTRYRKIYLQMGRWLDRNADLAIAVSNDVAMAPTVSHFSHVRTLLAGADVGRMRAWVQQNPNAPQEFRLSKDIPAGHKLIVTVGSLIPLKGQKYAIQALLDPRLYDVTLALIGEGPEAGELMRLVERLGLSERVRFVGRVVDAWRWTAVADALVHPSYFEGLPVTLMEAAALGTPIVATNVGGVQEVFDKGARGKLITIPETALVADGLVDVLDSIPPICHAFSSRAEGESFWSLQRYTNEFYAMIGVKNGG
ncbi:glycosyl transferase [Glutamicibacter protophormiae]|nr:glycosyl transferase [Glutamicibacter protophormiae]